MPAAQMFRVFEACKSLGPGWADRGLVSPLPETEEGGADLEWRAISWQKHFRYCHRGWQIDAAESRESKGPSRSILTCVVIL